MGVRLYGFLVPTGRGKSGDTSEPSGRVCSRPPPPNGRDPERRAYRLVEVTCRTWSVGEGCP